MRKTQTIAVLFGGRSSEHEISLRSCVFILKSLPEKYQILPIGIDRNGIFRSLTGSFTCKNFQNITIENLAEIVDGKVPNQFPESQNKESFILPVRKDSLNPDNFQGTSYRILNHEIDCVFPVLHGSNGEDGRLQGFLEMAEIAYIGCDMRASAVGMDKDIQKRLARDAGIPVAKYRCVHIDEFTENPQKILEEIEKKFSYPCFVKPNSMGSAVGTNKAKSQTELKRALQEAFAFDQKALVEEFLVGTEVECAFLGTETHPRVTVAGEISTDDFYSYEEKYSSSSKASLSIPAKLSPERMKTLQSYACTVAKAMGIYGLARIDFWNIKNSDEFVFNEYNTIPGMTSISMFPKLWEYEKIMATQWIEELIEKAFQRKTLQEKAQYGVKAQL